jgi:hypothetical protein
LLGMVGGEKSLDSRSRLSCMNDLNFHACFMRRTRTYIHIYMHEQNKTHSFLFLHTLQEETSEDESSDVRSARRTYAFGRPTLFALRPYGLSQSRWRILRRSLPYFGFCGTVLLLAAIARTGRGTSAKRWPRRDRDNASAEQDTQLFLQSLGGRDVR